MRGKLPSLRPSPPIPGPAPCAREEARTRTHVTTLLHSTARLDDPLVRSFLQLLDGTRDRAALLEALKAEYPDMSTRTTRAGNRAESAISSPCRNARSLTGQSAIAPARSRRHPATVSAADCAASLTALAARHARRPQSSQDLPVPPSPPVPSRDRYCEPA